MSASVLEPTHRTDLLDALACSGLGPLDRARSWLLRRRARFVRPLVARPELRHAWLGGGGVLLALLLSTCFPLTSLLLGPILLGVPHLVADVRYLLIRQGLHRRATCLPAFVPLVS